MKAPVVGFLWMLIVTPLQMQGQGEAIADPADSVLPVIRCTDFEVSGDGSNPEWNKTKWANLEQRTRNSPYQTRFKILYSKKGLYCLYECQDNKISATMKGENLDIYKEDVVEAFFWADERIPVYFEYELSPLNYELVLMVPNYDGNFLGWIPWHYSGERLTRHAVAIQQESSGNTAVKSWTGEFFIPYDLLKPMVLAPPEKGTRWRANFYRIDYDKGRSGWSWMPVEKTYHDYRMFGTILFE